MSVLLGPDVDVDLSFTAAEQVAVAVLAESGLVPPLRLIRGEGGRAPEAFQAGGDVSPVEYGVW